MILSNSSIQKIGESLYSLSFFCRTNSSIPQNHKAPEQMGKQEARNIDYNFIVESDKEHFG